MRWLYQVEQSSSRAVKWLHEPAGQDVDRLPQRSCGMWMWWCMKGWRCSSEKAKFKGQEFPSWADSHMLRSKGLRSMNGTGKTKASVLEWCWMGDNTDQARAECSSPRVAKTDLTHGQTQSCGDLPMVVRQRCVAAWRVSACQDLGVTSPQE